MIAFNLTWAAGNIAGAHLAKATTATIRRTLVMVPAGSLPHHETPPPPTAGLALGNGLDRLFDRVSDPPRQAT